MNLWLIPLLPLIGSAVNGLWGRNLPKKAVAAIGLLFPGASLFWTWLVAVRFFQLPAEAVPHIETYATWLGAGAFNVQYGLYLDQLSMLMALVVTNVGFLIHVYSVGYMEHEGGYYRFFSYLNLFMFFMLTLVLANNYLLMFVGWEGVGLASYLLIGFFFVRDSAASAGKKAFIVNRIGDFGFLIGLFLLIVQFGSLNFTDIFPHVAGMSIESTGAGVLTAIGLLLLVGATGKSAQLPLYVWLPDAMEGPTPVSALIHAATMVTAGVYMISRSHAIYDHAPIALTAVAVIGCATALFAATIALVQHDIKRVLAYSTISQLGYMVLACGVAAYGAGMFHLMTHAFFKALLFLAAGSVIHALGGEQDMRRMGGLRKHIPWTFWTMTAATLAIAGAPLFSGFFSKDEILWRAYSNPAGSKVYWAVGILTAGLTSFYMFRLWFLTFFGRFRGQTGHHYEAPGREEHHYEGHIHESPKIMRIPLLVLAVLSVAGGWIGVPEAMGGSNHFEHYLAPVFEQRHGITGTAEQVEAALAQREVAQALEPAHSAAEELALSGVATATAVLGFLLAWLFYYKSPQLPELMAERFRTAYRVLDRKYYVDEIYNAIFVRPTVEGSKSFLWRAMDVGVIDGTVNGAARIAAGISDTVRRMQSGNIRSYAGWVAVGAACIIAYMAWLGVR
jgi:NADH-quinone oxidoreductase subunit L